MRPQRQKGPIHPHGEQTQRNPEHLLQSKNQEGNKPTLHPMKKEVTLYMPVDCTSLDFKPFAWWSTNEPKYPHVAV